MKRLETIQVLLLPALLVVGCGGSALGPLDSSGETGEFSSALSSASHGPARAHTDQPGWDGPEAILPRCSTLPAALLVDAIAVSPTDSLGGGSTVVVTAKGLPLCRIQSTDGPAPTRKPGAANSDPMPAMPSTPQPEEGGPKAAGRSGSDPMPAAPARSAASTQPQPSSDEPTAASSSDPMPADPGESDPMPADPGESDPMPADPGDSEP